MTKRLVILVLSALLLVALATGVVGCEKHEHEYSSEVIAPTCTDDGYTKYKCECGKSKNDDYVSALGHNFSNYQPDSTNTQFEILTAVCENEGCNQSDYKLLGVKDSNLTKAIIPDFVTSIGDYAFADCSGLTSVVIPNGVTSIGDGAFDGCENLIFNEKNGLNYLGNEANPYLYLAGVVSQEITTAEIDDGCKFIGDRAFSYCRGLTSVEIPNGVTSIGGRAFDDCSGLTSIEIPNGVTSIGDRAFSYCRGLTSIEIPNGVTSIGDGAFDSCSNLTAINVDENNKIYCSIDGILYSKDKTTLIIYALAKQGSFTVPDYVLIISDGAFENCRGLTAVEIPDSVTYVGDSAFSGCRELTSVVIPNSIEYLGVTAFLGCGNLIYNEKNGLKYLGNEANPYLYLAGVVSQKITTAEIDDGCKFIGYFAFYGCSSLTSIEIPNGVTSIGDYAFGCSGLTSIEIPNGVTSIGSESFYCCENLTSIVIGKGVTSIGDSAFSGCSSLTSIEISNGVTSIGDWAFYDCSGLTSIEIPNSVTSIGDHAFFYCSGLTSIEIPNGVTSIGDHAFSYCRGLTSIEIPNGVTSIGDHAFDYTALNAVYYRGTKSDWLNINIHSGTVSLSTIYYYSETQPTGEGNYWHYDQNGNAVKW